LRCNNCGLDYIADNAANCPRCSAPMGQPGYQQPPQQYQQPQGYQEPQYQQQPQQYGDQQQPQYQQPAPQGGYYAPPQGGYYQQPPMPPKRVPTVRNINLTEVVLVVSGMFLFMGAFWNFSELYWGFWAPAFVLGILSLLAALLALGTVLVPALLKQIDGEMMSIIILVFAAILALWGLVITFSWDYGSGGEIVLTGGFGLLVAGLLRMGILK